jgi:uncharacterized protein YdiU (UPF0061 family)
MNSQTYFQERTTPFPSFDELRRTSVWNCRSIGRWRAIILAEIENKEQVYTLQLKERHDALLRRADGLAVLRSSIREHL